MTGPLHSLAVVLVRPRNTLNVGAVARAMSNFGASDLRLVSIFRKDFREAPSATGPAHAVLASAREFDSVAEAVADQTLVLGTTGALGRDWQQAPALLDAAATGVRAHLAAGRAAALVFGSEKTGLSNDDLSLCHRLLRIPTRDEHASMNLGQAAAVCLYELARTAEPPAQAEEPQPPTMAELVRLDGLLRELLAAADYPGADTEHRARQLRALLRRVHLPAADAPHWTGLLRHILFKVRAGR